MYIGLDVHKKLSYYSMVDSKGTEVKKGRFPTTCEGLDEFASVVPEGVGMAIEASTSGIFVYAYLDGRGREVHLAHPVYVKPFAKEHVKTDKVDAKVLAQLLRMDYLSESYASGKEIRDLRTIVRHRASLVRLLEVLGVLTLTPHHLGDMSHQIPRNILSFANQTLNRTDTFVFSYSPYWE